MSALYDSKSKLDDRGIKALLSQEAKIESWLKVESTLAKAQAELGFIQKDAAENICKNCKLENIDFKEMARIQDKVGHGFVPFLKVLIKSCSPEGGKYIHYGVTTQNIQQTSQLYILKEIMNKFKDFTADCLQHLAELANDHAYTVMAGRTHGRHATPITYGYKVSVWICELLQTLERIEESEKRIFQVMMGGAVGSFSATGAVGRDVQNLVAKQLHMASMEVPSRNMSISKIEFVSNLAMLCNTFHKMAEETYYTGIEEIAEVSEGFTAGTIGSSTMPQKINPKLSKGIIANAQKLYSLVSLGYYSSIRMFEGDSSSYMLFDGLLQESVELTCEVLLRAEELTRTLQVHKENMLTNANLNKGLDNSEYIMMMVAESIGKDKAHELMYALAMETEVEGKDYLSVLKKNTTLTTLFSEKQLEEMINPMNYIGQCATLANEMASKATAKVKKLKRYV